MNRQSMATGLVVLAALAGLVTIIGIVVFAVQNSSGHTGINPYAALVVFVPVTLIGIVIPESSDVPEWVSIFTVVIGVAGMLLLIFLNKSNTLLQYDVWIQRGMP